MINNVDYVEAEGGAGSWTLPDENPVWNIPKDENEIHFEMEFTNNPYHQVIRSLKGLAVSCKFGEYSQQYDRRVYGMRTLLNPKESGYQLEGRVSIGGKKYRAFTSSTLFEREDGSLCDVAVLHVCFPKNEEKPDGAL